MSLGATWNSIYALFRSTSWGYPCSDEQSEYRQTGSNKKDLLDRIDRLQVKSRSYAPLSGIAEQEPLKINTFLEPIHKNLIESYLNPQSLQDFRSKIECLEDAITRGNPTQKVRSLAQELLHVTETQKARCTEDLVNTFGCCVWVMEDECGGTTSYECETGLTTLLDDCVKGDARTLPKPIIGFRDVPSQAKTIDEYVEEIANYAGQIDIRDQSSIQDLLDDPLMRSPSECFVHTKNFEGENTAVCISKRMFLDLPRITVIKIDDKEIVDRISSPQQMPVAAQIYLKLLKALDHDIALLQNLCKLVSQASFADICKKLCTLCNNPDLDIYLRGGKQIHLTIHTDNDCIIIRHSTLFGLQAVRDLTKEHASLSSKHIFAMRETIIGKDALRKGVLDETAMISEVYSKFYNSQEDALASGADFLNRT
jgi:hypothetical protein